MSDILLPLRLEFYRTQSSLAKTVVPGKNCSAGRAASGCDYQTD